LTLFFALKSFCLNIFMMMLLHRHHISFDAAQDFLAEEDSDFLFCCSSQEITSLQDINCVHSVCCLSLSLSSCLSRNYDIVIIMPSFQEWRLYACPWLQPLLIRETKSP
jgi:hypothetical protein